MQMMRGVTLAAIMAITMLAGAGCRQPDGDMPVPAGEQPNKINDIGHDLQNVARGDAEAPKDLLDDLDGLDENRRPQALLGQLSAAMSEAVKDKPLSDMQGQELAQLLFVTTTADGLSPRQIDKLVADFRDAMMKNGIEQPSADKVASAATSFQSAFTLNRKRWYHIF
jgi:hypothetical protein